MIQSKRKMPITPWPWRRRAGRIRIDLSFKPLVNIGAHLLRVIKVDFRTSVTVIKFFVGSA
jgi:hypothetical protein